MELLDNVSDRKSADAAVVRLSLLGVRMHSLELRLEQLGEPSPAEAQQLKEYSDALVYLGYGIGGALYDLESANYYGSASLKRVIEEWYD